MKNKPYVTKFRVKVVNWRWHTFSLKTVFICSALPLVTDAVVSLVVLGHNCWAVRWSYRQAVFGVERVLLLLRPPGGRGQERRRTYALSLGFSFRERSICGRAAPHANAHLHTASWPYITDERSSWRWVCFRALFFFLTRVWHFAVLLPDAAEGQLLEISFFCFPPSCSTHCSLTCFSNYNAFHCKHEQLGRKVAF